MSTVAPERQEVRAVAKWVRIAPRKARLVVDHIRGRTVPEARTVLAFTTRAAAREIEKVLRSAVANAEANHGLVGDNLFVSEAHVDDGLTIKRWRPRARGRVARIKKRTCHITIKLSPVDGAAPVTVAEPAAKPPVRDSGPGEGVRGDREVPPASDEPVSPGTESAGAPTPEEKAAKKPSRRAPRKKKEEESED
jgi:large subunit ribosomal protein L22